MGFYFILSPDDCNYYKFSLTFGFSIALIIINIFI